MGVTFWASFIKKKQKKTQSVIVQSSLMVSPEVWPLQRHQKQNSYVRPPHKKGTQSIILTAGLG